ncbi:MAG TPA: hypothetical protein VFS43_13720 [Polyangiaceae bacterium]|nr:hypothetical protein [Polyangiaceae bacterium]
MATEILWTALPNGLVATAGALRLSVFVSPRVSTGPTLAGSTFEAWAARPVPAFQVAYEGGPTVDAVYAPGDWPRPDAALYQTLLPPTTPTTPYAFKNHAARKLRSYSVRRALNVVRSVYNEVAVASGVEFPSMASPPPQLAALFDALSVFVPRERDGKSVLGELARLDDLEAQKRIQALVPDPALADRAYQMYRAYRFYKRDARDSYDDSQPLPARPPPPKPDFHQIVAALGDYPTLLRALGFVYDYVVPPPPAALAEGRLRLVPLAPPAGAVSHCPFTEYRLANGGFFARSKSPELKDGVLQLGQPDFFEIYQVDADGSILKTWDYAINMVRRQNVQHDAPERESLPAQRTGGISVAQFNRSDSTKARLSAAAVNHANPGDASLDAHDLRRGYRLDVKDASGTWRSICARVGTMTVAGVELPPAKPDREGYIKSSAASSSAKPGEPDDLYLHEALCGWDGWSAVASRPGRTITFDEGPNHEQVSRVGYVKNEPATGVPLSGAFRAAPRSLPRLRFGAPYALRARVVDLAGNSLGLDDKMPPNAWESPPLVYRRFEPVAPPVLVPLRPVTEGESLEHMVIRSNFDQSAGDYASSLGPAYLGHNERHVAPPKTTQIMAETHGQLDGLDPQLAYNISVKEAGTFFDTEIFDYATGTKVPVADIELVTPAACPPALAKSLPITPRGAELGPGQYVIHKGPTIQLPYLPDPLSRGMVVQGLDPAGPVTIPFGGAWPDFGCFRVRAVEAGGASVGWSYAAGELRASLPKATILRLRFSSLPDADRLHELAHWPTIQSGPAALQAAAKAGLHWMLTPARELVLVHAVQQPLKQAEFTLAAYPSPSRGPGDTFVNLRGDVKVHGRSTSQLDVRAEWTDTLDLVDKPGPVDQGYRAPAFDLGVAYDDTVVTFGDKQSKPAKHEFGDTKHHLVTYYPDGTTRYREYFPLSITADPKNLTREGVASAEIVIPSSALPEPPKVLYAVPTFRWEQSASGSTKQAKRVGRGLRIYLDRPWFSSGNGEQLAIVLEVPGSSDAKRLKYVSEWGSDPAWATQKPATALAQGHFEGGAAAGPFPLADDPSVQVLIVAFDPQYHAGRKLWYVDVEFAPSAPSFYTFVRLGLARYQKHSLGGLHLSRVVRTEFGQIMADRSISIAPTTLATRFNVTLAGAAGLNAYGESYNANDHLLASLVTPLPISTAAADREGAAERAAEPANTIITPVLEPTINLDAGRSFRVTAQFERRALGVGDEFDLSWEAASAEQPLTPYTGPIVLNPPSSQLLWKALVSMPVAPQTGFQYRVVVREYERFPTDAEVQDGQHNYQPSSTTIPNEPLRYAERVSFVGTLPLP